MATRMAPQLEYDRERTIWLQAQGCRVIRFTNQQVMHELDEVIKEIQNELQRG